MRVDVTVDKVVVRNMPARPYETFRLLLAVDAYRAESVELASLLDAQGRCVPLPLCAMCDVRRERGARERTQQRTQLRESLAGDVACDLVAAARLTNRTSLCAFLLAGCALRVQLVDAAVSGEPHVADRRAVAHHDPADLAVPSCVAGGSGVAVGERQWRLTNAKRTRWTTADAVWRPLVGRELHRPLCGARHRRGGRAQAQRGAGRRRARHAGGRTARVAALHAGRCDAGGGGGGRRAQQQRDDARRHAPHGRAARRR